MFTYLTKDRKQETTLKVLQKFYKKEILTRGSSLKIIRTDRDKTFVNDIVIGYLCNKHVMREYN